MCKAVCVPVSFLQEGVLEGGRSPRLDRREGRKEDHQPGEGMSCPPNNEERTRGRMKKKGKEQNKNARQHNPVAIHSLWIE